MPDVDRADLPFRERDVADEDGAGRDGRPGQPRVDPGAPREEGDRKELEDEEQHLVARHVVGERDDADQRERGRVERERAPFERRHPADEGGLGEACVVRLDVHGAGIVLARPKSHRDQRPPPPSIGGTTGASGSGAGGDSTIGGASGAGRRGTGWRGSTT